MDLSAGELAALLSAVQTRLAEAAPAATSGIVRHLPDWAERCVVVSATAGETWLWCRPRSGGSGTFPGQIVLEAAPGRYFVEVFDARDGRHVSTESASSSPLVAGLTHAGSDVLIRVRRVSEG